MNTEPDNNELVEQQRTARAQEQYDILVLATVGIVPSVTTLFAFTLAQPTLVPDGHSDDMQILIDVMTIETWRDGSVPDGRVKVTGYGRRAQRDGDPDPGAQFEAFTLTPELAAPLLLAAMTRSPVAPRGRTQEGDAS